MPECRPEPDPDFSTVPSSPQRQRYFIPFLFAAAGVGLCGWSALTWRELKPVNPAAMDAEVAAQVEIQLARMGPHLRPEPRELTLLRAQIQHEVEGRASQPLRDVQRWLGFGLILLVAAAGHALFIRLTGARPVAG